MTWWTRPFKETWKTFPHIQDSKKVISFLRLEETTKKKVHLKSSTSVWLANNKQYDNVFAAYNLEIQRLCRALVENVGCNVWTENI